MFLLLFRKKASLCMKQLLTKVFMKKTLMTILVVTAVVFAVAFKPAKRLPLVYGREDYFPGICEPLCTSEYNGVLCTMEAFADGTNQCEPYGNMGDFWGASNCTLCYTGLRCEINP